jgi:hypothetical protein
VRDLRRSGATRAASRRDYDRAMEFERAQKLELARAQDEAATMGQSSKRRVASPRYAVGAADDAAEREADVTADVIARRLRAETETLGSAFAPATPSRIRRREVPAEGVIGSAGGPMDDSLADELDRSRRGGQPLAAPHRGRIERAMHTDLSAVKIHADPAADRLANRIQARAFTSGSDVYFAQGQYRPGTEHGDHLLAHELAHVAQQSGGRIHRSTVQRPLSVPGEYEERAQGNAAAAPDHGAVRHLPEEPRR